MGKSKRHEEQHQDKAGDPAFERWVSRQLHKIYDEVLAEDVPPELLEVVERFGHGPSGEADGDGSDAQLSKTRTKPDVAEPDPSADPASKDCGVDGRPPPKAGTRRR